MTSPSRQLIAKKISHTRKLNMIKYRIVGQLDDLIKEVKENDKIVISFKYSGSLGYSFKFSSHENLTFYADNLKLNIHDTKTPSDVFGLKSDRKDVFTIADDNCLSGTRLNREDGLDFIKLYELAKLCSSKLGLTLCQSLDVELIVAKHREIHEEEMRERAAAIRNSHMAIINKDMDFIKLFEKEFNIPDFMVLDSFVWIMGQENYEPSFIVNLVKEIWQDIPDKENKAIGAYLPLISKYVKTRMER